MILPHGAFVVVADGKTMRLLRNRASEPDIDLDELDHPSLATSNAGSGLRHHNEAANPDSDRKTEDGFAAAIAALLNRMVLDGTLQQLFVIADPRTMGELRKHFSSVLLRKVIGEESKDLTKHSLEDIKMAVRNA